MTARPSWRVPLLVLAFVGASAGATVAVAMFGPDALLWTAAGVIGMTMVVRDALHDAWTGRALRLRMGAMILTGAAVAAVVNRNAGAVALASGLAFLCAESVDAAVYHHLSGRSWFVRANGSNLFSAAVDSLVFPFVAFGMLDAALVGSQFAGKFLGGVVWAFLLAPLRRQPSA